MFTENIELVLTFLDNPKEAMKSVITKKPVFLSLVVFVFANISFCIANSTVFPSGNINFILIMFFVLFSNILILVTASCCFHFIAELLNGQGSVVTLFQLLNFSLAPMILLLPVSIIGKYVDVRFYYFALIIVFIWLDYLVFISIKTLYNISIMKTWFIAISPFIILSIIFITVFTFSVIGLFSVFSMIV
ncbi:MAG: YIP1 family protein [Elusimicrobia bacterium]|nr:YIP1 family protein [Elusimicrobiota bacterium]